MQENEKNIQGLFIESNYEELKTIYFCFKT